MKYLHTLLCLLLLLPGPALAQEPTARDVVARAWDYMRGRTSVSVVHMTVHRPDWERKSTIKAWTKGREDSIFQIVAPAKDKGNGTLKKGREMWTYNPKINRVVKIPPSMMSQSWMGSDFSNNDLSKADSILLDYDHSIEKTGENDGLKVYTIRAMPKPDAPVVWGMQRITIREDGVLMEQSFHDEDLEPVKVMTTGDIREMGGRPFPRVWKMRSLDAETDDEYTLLEYESLEFDVKLRDSLFTLNALKKPVR
ncbi:outer membrane lipoprotein-sorting protein [Salidesulfovibrio onnuriiensis]|uniref:outer membrane lipoprotein-sorting protein n=1 Tax=Salidesulfovibrio onnuriiensis TaxID=2583823 RepID=UPI0011CB8BD1|nr:outer membrane lipoprotein-sorting protein [Salidesulfovibrio onnuriiensis]